MRRDWRSTSQNRFEQNADTLTAAYIVSVAPTRAFAQRLNGSAFASEQHPTNGRNVTQVTHFNGTWMVRSYNDETFSCTVTRGAVRGRTLIWVDAIGDWCDQADHAAQQILAAVLPPAR